MVGPVLQHFFALRFGTLVVANLCPIGQGGVESTGDQECDELCRQLLEVRERILPLLKRHGVHRNTSQFPNPFLEHLTKDAVPAALLEQVLEPLGSSSSPTLKPTLGHDRLPSGHMFSHRNPAEHSAQTSLARHPPQSLRTVLDELVGQTSKGCAARTHVRSLYHKGKFAKFIHTQVHIGRDVVEGRSGRSSRNRSRNGCLPSSTSDPASNRNNSPTNPSCCVLLDRFPRSLSSNTFNRLVQGFDGCSATNLSACAIHESGRRYFATKGRELADDLTDGSTPSLAPYRIKLCVKPPLVQEFHVFFRRGALIDFLCRSQDVVDFIGVHPAADKGDDAPANIRHPFPESDCGFHLFVRNGVEAQALPDLVVLPHLFNPLRSLVLLLYRFLRHWLHANAFPVTVNLGLEVDVVVRFQTRLCLPRPLCLNLFWTQGDVKGV